MARAAVIETGLVFPFGGRSMRVHRVEGRGKRMSVIVEELAPVGAALSGQFSLWSSDGIKQAIRSAKAVNAGAAR